LRALHSTAPDKKDSVIRDTVADLRDVINHSHDGALDLDEMLADLRAETAERLEPHRIGLSWSLQADAGLTLTPASIHALRSVVREAASNTIKHANASVFIVSIMVSEGDLQVQITDDGEGFATAAVHRGKGLANMKARIESVGGTFLISTEGAGPKLAATLALDGVRT
jgi:signal transduction histidine kinase